MSSISNLFIHLSSLFSFVHPSILQFKYVHLSILQFNLVHTSTPHLISAVYLSSISALSIHLYCPFQTLVFASVHFLHSYRAQRCVKPARKPPQCFPFLPQYSALLIPPQGPPGHGHLLLQRVNIRRAPALPATRTAMRDGPECMKLPVTHTHTYGWHC